MCHVCLISGKAAVAAAAATSSDPTLAILALSTTTAALYVTVLLWYANVFINALASEEEKDATARAALAQSARPLWILLAALAVLASTTLAFLFLNHSIQTRRFAISGNPFALALLIACLSAPAVGATIATLMVGSETGWYKGVGLLIRNLVLRVGSQPLRLEAHLPARSSPFKQLKGPGAPFPDAWVAEWKLSYDWVRSHERRWGLGKGFLATNEAVLRGLAARATQSLVNCDKPMIPPAEIELEIADAIAVAIRSSGRLNAILHGRPLQISRASLYLLSIHANG